MFIFIYYVADNKGNWTRECVRFKMINILFVGKKVLVETLTWKIQKNKNKKRADVDYKIQCSAQWMKLTVVMSVKLIKKSRK